ncbi:hypothetical protein SAMN04487906_1901 [Zhouia amylolytica]|uniref:Glycosyl hydrolases family 43 n=1 Tax=Zhouia amylolytica TaxID=376730 RepID=A0A1I6T7M7_9FLAO|nr:hypothetical protein [Zhouia amylolytica]SFS85224.1 hypothetical protein SAMN04487906_1901 [Zhouia amylolytica]
MKKIFFLIFIGICSCKVSKQDISNRSLLEKAEIPYIKGESKLAFNPKPSTDFDDNKWFTNDHCFVEDESGILHWFGINNPFPPEGKQLYRYHPYLGHLTTDAPEDNWKREDFAVNEINGTEYIGAPYIVKHEESGRWVMVVEQWRENRQLEVYWSDDLYNWEETKNPILPNKLWIGTRDPHIMKGSDGKYWIHVVATGNKGVNQSQVLRIRTKDFVNFDEPETILGIDDNNWATLIESPYLVERNGMWYLFFTYAHRRYAETIVVVSDNPDHFNYKENVLTTMFGHAAEIFRYKGKEYITSCGPEDAHYLNSHGVTIAELGWLNQ